MKELTEILDEEREVYSKYLKLAGKKREALIKNNIDLLPKITDIERKLSTKILQLENKRKLFLREEGYETNVTIGEILANLANKDEHENQETLEQTAKKLKETLEQCKKFNDNNMALVRQSSSYINHMIKVFTKSDKSSESATYQKNAAGKIENIRLADIQG
jgi:flagellar biosynthesis/type III secretory pathway chaperone